MKVFAATIEHKHGTELYLAATAELLQGEIAGYVHTWWEDEMAGIAEPGDEATMIAKYFDRVEGEFLNEFGATEVTAVESVA